MGSVQLRRQAAESWRRCHAGDVQAVAANGPRRTPRRHPPRSELAEVRARRGRIDMAKPEHDQLHKDRMARAKQLTEAADAGMAGANRLHSQARQLRDKAGAELGAA